MIRKLVFILLFLFFSLVLSTAYEIDSITFVPREFYVGDVVDMRISIKLSPGTMISIPEELPRAEWIYLRDLEMLESDGMTTIHITFSSFQPGIRLLPPIDLGGIILEGLKLDTASILEEEFSPFLPAADPMYLPRTALYFALIVGSVLGIPLLFILFFKGLKNRIRRVIVAAGRKRPYVRLQKVLHDLERKILNRDGNVFYTALLLELKNYMSARTGVDFSTLTSMEVCLLLDSLFPEEFFKGTLKELFKFSDQVKFGGLDPYTARKKEDLNRLDEAVKALEIFYRHQWAAEEREGALNVDS